VAAPWPGLLALAVRDFALIEDVEVQFGPGLNVLSGETGAGKSLILDALALALGGRARADVVRSGAEVASVDALFRVDPSGPAARLAAAAGAPPGDDGTLLLQREVARDGRSLCRLNGRLCTAAQLRAVGECLVDVHGQGEQQRLLRPAEQRALLDLFAGPEAQRLLAAIADVRGRLAALEAERARLAGDPRERERRRDLLRFARDEIAAAGLRPDEEEELAATRALLRNGERLATAAAAAYEGLHGPVSDHLGRIVTELGGLTGVDPRLAPLAASLREALILVQETAHELRRYRDGLSFTPNDLQRAEERWELLQRLKRKYGDSLAEVIAYGERADAELAQWEETEAVAARLAAEAAALQAELRELAARLSELRAGAGRRLGEAVQRELAALGLAGASLRVAVAPTDEVGPHGADQVEFLFSANPGERERPLHRAASGGELSRAMLALKAVLAAQDDVPVLVFDEVDSGVGGRAAQAVAQRLGDLGRWHQVFCVTHLAVVAARADHHFAVSKSEQGGRVRVAVAALTGAARREEIARMLAGGGDAAARAHAEELLRAGQRQRPAGR
jgi:DNA repair protein RecN (Recombination protein N)